MRIYHIGMSKRGKTLVIEARRDVDYLSCEIYDYYGRRITTKKQLHENRYSILNNLKAVKPETYGDLRYAIVD